MIYNKGSILLVDDTPENLNILMNILREDGYDIRSTTRGDKALSILEHITPDLFLLDINMPGMNGFELCSKIKKIKEFRSIPVIFISALTDTENKVLGFELGGVDYITKPFRNKEVRARVKTHISNRKMSIALEEYNTSLEKMVSRQIDEIKNSQIATIFALAKLAESRDDDTGKHLERVQNYCQILAEELSNNSEYSKIINDEFITNIFNASPLHDIGKVGIPDRILLKKGKLNFEEFEIMKNHTTIGAKTLEAVIHIYPNNMFVKMGAEVAIGHHENWDGSGYPSGIAGKEIPLAARIMSIADVYDALKSKRCYKEPYPQDVVTEMINGEMSYKFDPVIIKAFKVVSNKFLSIFNEII